MSFLLALAGQWRLIGMALVAAGLIYGGFYIKSKFARAAEADRLETERDMAQETAELAALAYKKADQDRILMSAQIADFQEQLRADVGTAVKTVRVLIKDSRACDLSIETIKTINAARGQP